VNVKVEDLMRSRVITAQPHHTVEHVRGLLARNKITAVPIVDSDNRPVGIASAKDVLAARSATAPISKVMTPKVYTVPRYEDVSIAARVMRNHDIHRVIVTDEDKVVGVLSSFDLLKLVEDHRFTMKQKPTPARRMRNRRE
jgi:CBS domain-containing protein